MSGPVISAGLNLGQVVLQPEGWPTPKGYANGIMATGQTVFVGGMVGWDRDKRFVPGFVGQAQQALKNIVAVLAVAGGAAEHVVRMTWYVVNINEYLDCQAALGTA